MVENTSSNYSLPDCTGYQTCHCFEKLPAKPAHINFENPEEYVRFHINYVEEHLNMVYKHQVSDQLFHSSQFAFVQARHLKKALDDQIETLKFFERVLKDA